MLNFAAVNTQTIEWYTQNAEEVYQNDRVLRERIMHGNAEALLRL